MNQSNSDFLDQHRSVYTTLVNAGFIQNLTNEVRQDFLRIIREEFSPGYLCCLHCGGDVAAMVKYAYTQFDTIPKEAKLIIETVPKPKKVNAKPHKNIS